MTEKHEYDEFDDPWDAIMVPIERQRREEAAANRRPFLSTMVLGIQFAAAFVGIIAIIAALFPVFRAIGDTLSSASFWMAVASGAIFVAGEWALQRLPATMREKQLRKPSN